MFFSYFKKKVAISHWVWKQIPNKDISWKKRTLWGKSTGGYLYDAGVERA